MITTDLFESRDICRVCGQTPCNCTHISEEKVRLDPKCWKGKKIGNPKTKMKGGVRVNNCVPAESLNEFAPGGDEGNSPYAYAIALKEMARLYAEGAFDYDLAPGSKEQNESDAEDISQVADAFMNQGMEAGREAYNMVDTGVRDEMDSYLKDQGFNVQNDIHAEYQKEVERYRNSPQGQAQAQAQAAKNAEYAKGAPARKANEVVVSAVDATTGEEEFSKISFDRGSVSPEQLRAKIQRSVAELKQHFVDYPGRNPSEKIIKVTIGGKPVDINQGIAEDHDNGEYSDEAGMAHGNLITIAKAARGLLDTIDQHEDLPEWVQEKIAKVEGMLVSAWNYLQSQEAQGIDPRITEVYGTLAEAWSHVRNRMELVEEFDIIERVVEGLAVHNGVDQEVIWEDLESLTDDELYVFAVTTPIMEDWQKVNKRDKTDGMSRKAVKAYRREHPGSKLKTAVTTKPSKLKKGSKASKRRKSYCSRSRGQMKMHNISCAKTPDKAICKARRRWNCEGVEPTHTMLEGEVVPFKRAAPSWQKLPRDVLSLANDWFWADYESGGLQATMDPKGLGSGIANQQKYLGAQLQQRGWAIDIDDEFENVVLKNRQGQTILLPIEDAQDFTGWAQGTNPVSEQGMAEANKLPGTPVVSLKDFGDKDNTKDRYGRTVPRKLKKDDPRVRFHKEPKKPGVAEADDPKFVGFMNKAMANKVDAPKADPLAKAPDWYKNAPAMNFDSMPSHKKALQFGLKVLSKLDPETKQQLAAGGEQAIVDYLVDVSERTLGARGTIDFVEEDIWECQDYLSNVFHDPNITSWVDVLKTGLNEVSDATLTSYLTKVDADARKHRADPTKRPAQKRNRSVSGFARAFNKLDARKEKVDEISKQKLGDYLHAAHQDVVDRATSSSFQSGKAGDKYNRADVSPKEKQRQAGMARAVSRLTRENSMADELAQMAMKRNPKALVRVDGKTLQSPALGPKPAGTAAPRPAPRFDPEAEYSDDYSVWHRRTKGLSEGSSIAEAWARRYPNLNSDIAECKYNGDSERLQRLLSIKNIIDSDSGIKK